MKFFITNILSTNNTFFVTINNPELSKNLDIAYKACATVLLSSALGVQDRGFKSCRPDSNNPSHTSEFPDSLFYFSFVLKSHGRGMGEDLYNFG